LPDELTSEGVWDGRFSLHKQVRGADQSEASKITVAVMARETYPFDVLPNHQVRCLLPARLEDIVRMLAHQQELAKFPSGI